MPWRKHVFAPPSGVGSCHAVEERVSYSSGWEFVKPNCRENKGEKLYWGPYVQPLHIISVHAI